MTKIKYTREDIEAVYDEVDRRIEFETKDGTFDTIFERWDYRAAMLQGVYGTLMVTAQNWPDVAFWTTVIETRYDDEYEAVEAARKVRR